jgi:hypothetical protein
MAGVGFSIQTAKIATGTSAKTIAQLVASANVRAVVDELSISFDGTVNSGTPILVEAVRQTSAGTMSAQTVRKTNNSDQETLNTTAQNTATAEPTDSGDVPWSELVHPQTGYTWQAPYGKEISVQGGTRLGIRVTAAAGVNCVVRIKGQE